MAAAILIKLIFNKPLFQTVSKFAFSIQIISKSQVSYLKKQQQKFSEHVVTCVDSVSPSKW